MSPAEPPRGGWARRPILGLIQALVAVPGLARRGEARPMPRPADLPAPAPAEGEAVFEAGVFEEGVFR